MPQRIGELAVLPVFFKLEGCKVILAGGTKAAAWKAELLAASGAEVHIYAEELEPGFTKLITDESYKGSFTFHQQSWQFNRESIFTDAKLAICDAEGAKAESFYAAAKSAGIPVNVIDKPALCDFQFGSIVNRSPVVVSISTAGAAPILGQAIRCRIETLLPQSLSFWASLAASIRKTVNHSLKAGAPRRIFWQDFTNRAFTTASGKTARKQLLGSIQKITNKEHLYQLGTITQIKTDPLDAELLTLKSIRALQASDVIIYDNQISASILELARREAEHIPTRFFNNSSENIAGLVQSLAQAGKNVVRLKSNDTTDFQPVHDTMSSFDCRDCHAEKYQGMEFNHCARALNNKNLNQMVL